MRTPISRLQLREHDKIWDAIDILEDVGVNPNSIVLIVTRIKAVNAKRPVANRKDLTEATLLAWYLMDVDVRPGGSVDTFSGQCVCRGRIAL